MPKTPRALNVLRSAWIPAPPPESLPAIVRARGRERSTGKVIPPRRRERCLGAALVYPRETGLLHDLADVRERDAETLVQLRACRLDRQVRERDQQLVVLSPAERILERRALGDGDR